MEQSNLFLHKFYTQLSHKPTQAGNNSNKLHTLHRDKPEEIDQLVAVELQQLKTHYADEEQRYVEQMLIENPIVVERRAAAMPQTVAQQQVKIEAQSQSQSQTKPNSRDAQRLRAESCRKSRYKQKVKKAKLRFRHKFMCSQLAESAGVLDYMREVIAQAESQLLARGFNQAALGRMRQNFGLDRSEATMDH